MRTTSAEMTSPDFISWLLMLSANRSAKLSPPVASEVGMVDIKLNPLATMAVKKHTGADSLPQRSRKNHGPKQAGTAITTLPCGLGTKDRPKGIGQAHV